MTHKELENAAKKKSLTFINTNRRSKTMPEQNNTVSAAIKSGDHAGKSATISYNFGADLKEAVDLYGDTVVFSNYLGQATVTVQAGVRRNLIAGSDPQHWADEYKLGMAKPRRSKVEKTIAGVQEASMDELKKIQAEIKTRVAALQSRG